MSTEIQLIEQPSAVAIREELDVAITTAKAYPRNIEAVLNEVQSYISIDPEIAKTMWYSIPRGNTVIEGPSIRLAEIFLSCWGNIRVQSRIREITDTHVVAEAIAFDIEKNIAVMKEARRRITTKDGVRYNDDLIQQTAQGAISIAIRNALFTVIPRVFIQRAMQYAKEITIKHPQQKKKSINELLAELAREFSEFNITKDQLLSHLNKKESDVTSDDIIYLRGVLNALRDGEIKNLNETLFDKKGK